MGVEPLRITPQDPDQRLDDLEAWRIKHMGECHPELLKANIELLRRVDRVWGRLWAIVGFVGGIGLVLGYVIGAVLQWLPGR